MSEHVDVEVRGYTGRVVSTHRLHPGWVLKVKWSCPKHGVIDRDEVSFPDPRETVSQGRAPCCGRTPTARAYTSQVREGGDPA